MDEDGWRPFLKMCAQLKTSKQFNDFFELFLTAEERQDLAMRYLIVRDLLQGEKTQREIAKTLHVSIAKITRGSNQLKTINSDLRRFVQAQIT